jgi:Tol biopolymer transport system component
LSDSNKNIIFFLIIVVIVFKFQACSENPAELSKSTIPEYTQIDFEASWSKSGNRIAFVHSDVNNDFTGIYLLNSDGTNSRQLLNVFANSPDWSPDGNWIAITLSNSIYKIKTNGDSLTELTDAGINSRPKWSSDGNWISYISCSGNACNLWIMKPDGQQKTLIDVDCSYANWANGSSSLIYFKPIKDNNSIQSGDTIFQYFFTGTKVPVVILNDDDHVINSYPVFAGDAIIFSSLNKAGYVYVYRMNLNGSDIIKLTSTQGYSPDYSLANDKIIYTNRNKGNGRLWIMDKSGNGKTQFTF